jgi:hypothetical protein
MRLEVIERSGEEICLFAPLMSIKQLAKESGASQCGATCLVEVPEFASAEGGLKRSKKSITWWIA